MNEEEILKQVKHQPTKLEKMLRISFYILVISIIMLLGVWAVKLVFIMMGLK